MYIIFEGIDRSGKSTLSKLVSERFDYLWTKQPYNKEIDKLIKSNIPDEVRYQLMIADRIQSNQELLLKNDNIVSDRGFISGCAYSMADGYDVRKVVSDYKLHIPDLREPDLVIFMKIDETTLIDRMGTLVKSGDFIEMKGIKYLLEVQGHMERAIEYLDYKTLVIDATQNLEEVQNDVFGFLNSYLNTITN